MPDRLPVADHLTVPGAFGHALAHPWRVFILGWNWKVAFLSAVCRLAVWPLAVVGHGKLLSAGSIRGFCIEFAFRIVVGGFWGSLLQLFSKAQPLWLAALCSAFLLPGLSHVLEYEALRVGGATHVRAAIVISVAFSVVSSVINWSLMRRGMLLTGRGAASLVTDLRRILPGEFGVSCGAGQNLGDPVL